MELNELLTQNKNLMELYQQKIILTAIVLISVLLARIFFRRIVEKTLKRQQLFKSRGNELKRVMNLVFLALGIIIILIVWGVSRSDLTLFIGSAFTIIGVAFFAQWSLLSNVTSSIILFFNHPVRMNDTISIMEGKDYELKGKVIKIGLFFVTLKTEEGEELTLPNNVFIQKSIMKINQ